MKLKGKKILVTGGASGYGYGMARILSASGGDVWITGRDEGRLTRAAAALKVHGVLADASLGADWDAVLEQMGGIDVLINNDGFGGTLAPVSEQTDEAILATLATNLTGVILGCARAARIMCAQRSGAIINISSVCALSAWPSWSVYTAAKAGVAKFSHGLYTEVRPYGVRVTCLTPSWGQTGFNVAAGIRGAAEDPVQAAQCISPDELGELVKSLLLMPDHLVVPDITIQPLIQEITPM